jgi:hypothetical protein
MSKEDLGRKEIDALIGSLPPEKRLKVIVSLHAVMNIQNKDEMTEFMSQLDPDIGKVLAEIHLLKLKHDAMEEKNKELESKTEPIRQSALVILTTLIISGAKEDDSALVVRAASMAIKLHDFF